MMLDILWPTAFGDDLKELHWLAAPGAQLAAGTPLLIGVSDQVELMLPAPADGVLAEVLVTDPALVAGGTCLARWASVPSHATEPRRRITPVAHAIARAHDLDLSQVAAFAVDGWIRKADVLRLIAPEPLEPPASMERPADPFSQPMGLPATLPLATVQSTAVLQLDPRNIPIGIAVIDADMRAVLAAIDAQRELFALRGLRLTPSLYVLQALVDLLPQFPAFNSCWWEAAQILQRRRVHLAVARSGAIGRDWILVRDASDLNLRGLARALAAGPLPWRMRPLAWSMRAIPVHGRWYNRRWPERLPC
jgi:2-oxoglutarate dehydrogenase E2 component (dihydrolipoamide succinyltransferase)